jgi:glucose-6-phosphate 1-dehydrogenase
VLQVLGFLAMEPPRSLEPDAIRDETVKLLRAVDPLQPGDVVRARYAAGTVDGEGVPGYLEEDGVAPGSSTETFVAARASIDNWRWSGVPFFLRTGKRLAGRATEIAVVFRDAPSYLWEDIGVPRPAPNHLTIRIQPGEGIAFAFEAKEPGAGFVPRTVHMDFAYEDAFPLEPAEAYERLIHDAMSGDHTLFTRTDGVERAWEIVGPVLDAPGPAEEYPAGSWGPAAADELIAPRLWHLRR